MEHREREREREERERERERLIFPAIVLRLGFQTT
jgi:hypothetical protein